MEIIEDLEARLRRDIEKVFEAGLYMNDGKDYGVDNDGDPAGYNDCLSACGVCLLGAVLLGVPDSGDTHRRAAGLLGIKLDDVLQLENGYAGWDQDADRRSPYFQLGERLRRDYFEIQEAAAL